MPDDWQKNLATEVDSMQSNTRGNLLTEIQFEAMRKKNLSIQKDRVTSELLSMKSRINQAQLKCRNLSTDIQHRLSENMECDRKLCEAETDASHVKMKNESLVEIQQLMVKKDRLRKIHSNSTIPEDPVQKVKLRFLLFKILFFKCAY
ncbi:unnamed protein product [Soboliphyme baturini]|uniref:Coiled-coil domain-containing protein 39 n=1 Tax=Soboliphyme baturini TaxID=241478 RepID=A0A183J6U7_9BILA|nr:unnamed protein product [Soboliphyme baturini]